MPGFRYCSWCQGKGCIMCDKEEKAYAKKAIANAPKWREPDVRDVRNQALRDETKRLEALIGVAISTQEQFKQAEAEAHAAIEAAFKPELDAEYARQFPSGPTPIFTARTNNELDVSLMREAFGIRSLEAAFSEGSGGIEEIVRKATEARSKQDPPIDYKPIGKPRED